MKEYKMKKGNHYSRFHPQIHAGITSMSREVMFTESCLYQPINKDYREDINKLFGWSMGYHKRDSVRFGWEPEEDKNGDITGRINIYAYSYSGGERIFDRILTVSINTPYVFEIEKTKHRMSDMYMFNVYRKEYHSDHLFIDWFKYISHAIEIDKPIINSGYLLNPYFGGDEPAQHDTIILMSKPIIK